MASLSVAENVPSTSPAAAKASSPPRTPWARGWAWAKGATMGTVDYTVTHGAEIAALAVDGSTVVGVGQDVAHRAQIAAPWLLRLLSTWAPSYHMDKGMSYLDEAFSMIKQEGKEMPLIVSKMLLTTYNELRQERDVLQKAKPQSRTDVRDWKGRVKNLLYDVRRSAEQARTETLMRDLEANGNGTRRTLLDAHITSNNQMQPGILRPYHGPGIDAVTCSNLSARTNEDPFRDPEGDDVSYVECADNN